MSVVRAEAVGGRGSKHGMAAVRCAGPRVTQARWAMTKALALNPVVVVVGNDGHMLQVSGLLPLRIWGVGYRPAWHLRPGDRVLAAGAWRSVLCVRSGT